MKNINDYIYSQETIDLLDDLIFIKNEEGIYINCNKAFSLLLNLEKDEIIGKDDYDLFDKDDAKSFTSSDKEILKTKKDIVTFETFSINTDNILHFKTKKVLTKKENQYLIIGMAKDITIQKEYKILHQTNQKVLEKIIDGKSLEEILTYILLEVQRINKNMICSILLLNKEGTHFENGFAPSLPEYYNKALNGLKIGEGVGSCGTAAFLKKRVIVEDINTHPYWEKYVHVTKQIGLNACWSQPFFTENKEVLGTFAVYYTSSKYPNNFEIQIIESFSQLVSLAINKTRRLEKFKEKENLLIQRSKMASLGEMIENIAHQWRQPLSVISTLTSALKLKNRFKQHNELEFDNSLQTILNSTKYLSNTIDDFRTYFLSNKTKQYFNVNDSLNKALNIIEAKFNNTNIQFIADIDDIQLFTYENELIHIFLNIFNNSKDAFELNNCTNKYIFIDISKSEDSCIIIIKDTAKGIPEDIINKIFEPYFTTKHKYQGTGIGLYMAQDILKRHMNGKIKVQNSNFTYENVPFYGAQFEITLPLR